MTTRFELAGDCINVTETADGTSVFTFSEPGTGRVCSDCQLCCRLVPVPEIRKAAGARCVHARYGKGCAIHAHRPISCRTWSCRWLADPRTTGMPRPDRCHYVIDMMAGEFVLRPPGAKEPMKVAAVLVYLDPAFPHAHRASELRAYLLRMAKLHGAPTVVRVDGRDKLAIIPPPISPDGKWQEIYARHQARAPTAWTAELRPMAHAENSDV
jgi:hypothetical protein